MRIATWLSLSCAGAALVVGGACASFGDANAGDAGTGAADATPGGPDASLDASAGGNDAGADARCRVIADESFDDLTSRSRWTFLGAATIENGQAELVPDQSYAAGAIWLTIPDPGAGILHARYKTTIEPVNGDDGIAFAWVSTTAPKLGRTGQDFGVCGADMTGGLLALSGFFDEVQAVEVTNGCNVRERKKVTVDGKQNVEVSVAGQVTGFVSGTPFSFNAPNKLTIRTIGFSAATGGGHARHAIDDVYVEICNE